MHQRNQLCPVQLLTEETIRKFQVENILNNKKIHLSRNRKLGIRQALACMCAETKCLMNNEIVTNWCVLFIFLFYGLVQSVHIWCIQMYHVFFFEEASRTITLRTSNLDQLNEKYGHGIHFSKQFISSI